MVLEGPLEVYDDDDDDDDADSDDDNGVEDDDNDEEDLVVLESPLKVAPVTPSEDHVGRATEYLGHDYHEDHDDDSDDHDDFDNGMDDRRPAEYLDLDYCES